jgi:abortive infection bacteriophage resistance protein
VTKLHDEAERSSEAFVAHFRSTYQEYPDLPIWVITEIMSFGSLSKMYQGMWKQDQKAISGYYGLQPDVMGSWMHHMTYVRNLCAHHSRLWDRIWSVKPKPAHGSAWRPPCLPGNNRLFITLVMLSYFMKRCPAIASFAVGWRSRVEGLMARLPSAPDAMALLGLPSAWKSHPHWG